MTRTTLRTLNILKVKFDVDIRFGRYGNERGARRMENIYARSCKNSTLYERGLKKKKSEGREPAYSQSSSSPRKSTPRRGVALDQDTVNN